MENMDHKNNRIDYLRGLIVGLSPAEREKLRVHCENILLVDGIYDKRDYIYALELIDGEKEVKHGK